ncbi:acyltransferase [Methanosarcina lacustris]|uniref:acyltransferase n=1 Tax=Methanosarcina lacustris TaxID=170861 RepID=UPI000696056D|nr:acyltransferase [Methanosarcina lacustris]
MNYRQMVHFLLNYILNIHFYLNIIYSFFYKYSFKKVGESFIFDGLGSTIINPFNIEIGNDVFIGKNAYISIHNSLKIGNSVMIGPNVTIIGGDHNFAIKGKKMSQVKSGGINLPIVIQDDVWIGANVTILKGVVIGEGSIIGAGSVVTKAIPKYTIAAGNPAKLIRKRFNN